MSSLVEQYIKNKGNIKANPFYLTRTQTGKRIKFEEFDGEYIPLTTSDYLGIGGNSEIADYAMPLFKQWGFGRDGNTVQNGRTLEHKKLENYLCKMYNPNNNEDDSPKNCCCLLMNCATTANRCVIFGLIQQKPMDKIIFFSDKYNHNSIIRPIIEAERSKLATIVGIEKVVFNHMDYDDLEKKMEQSKKVNQYDMITRYIYGNNKLKMVIITDGTFSMMGSYCNASRLEKIREKYNAILIIDECHSLGTLRSGVLEECNVKWNENIILTGTFCKSVQSSGGYIVCSKSFKLPFLETETSFFTGCPTAFNCGVTLKSIQLIMNEDRVGKLRTLVFFWRQIIFNMFKKLYPEDQKHIIFYSQNLTNPIPIVPIFIPFIKEVKPENSVLYITTLFNKIMEKGIYVVPIIWKAVTPGDELLRSIVSLLLTKDDLIYSCKKLEEIFEDIKKETKI